MTLRRIGFADLAVFVLLIVAAVLLLLHGKKIESPDAIATLVGALFGAAALLLGNWINRWNERRFTNAELAERITKLKALIAAELVNVAAGLIGAKDTMDAAIATSEAGGTLPTQEDLTRDTPRHMQFTDNLGAELVILTQRDIDVLMTLRSNLTMTRLSMDEVTLGRRHFGWLTARQLRGGICHDMQILAEAFEQFAPTRQITLPGNAPELAFTLLRRLATIGEPP